MDCGMAVFDAAAKNTCATFGNAVYHVGDGYGDSY
jgi:hypothetical protein